MRVASAILAILLPGLPAFALNPSLDIDQYGHVTWTLRDGAFRGFPLAFAQTSDGYLWLGTELGLLRFDGVRFVSWQPPQSTPLPSSFVVELLATRDGSLWIGTSQGLARWKDGTLTTYRDLANQHVPALVEGRDGTVWAGTDASSTDNAKLCAIDVRGVQCYGNDGVFGHMVIALSEDDSGNLWVGAGTGLWRWRPLPQKVYPTGDSPADIYSVTEDETGTVLVAFSREVRRLVHERLETYPIVVSGQPPKPTALLRDRDGGLWIGTQGQGLLHVHRGRTDRFARVDGLSSDSVVKLFEDREGNIWVATSNGLDCFRETAVTTVSMKQGLSSDSVVSVLAMNDRSVWFGTTDGVNRWDDGQIQSYRTRRGLLNDAGSSLFQDAGGQLWVSAPDKRVYPREGRFTSLGLGANGYVSGMADDAESNLWVSDQDRGLLRLRDRQVVELIPWARLGGSSAGALAHDPRRGGLWLGFVRGGVSYLEKGQIRESFTAADGLAQGEVTSLLLEEDGTLWVGAQGGLSRLRDGRVVTLTSRNGLPCDAVSWVIDDDARAFWVRTSCGLVHIVRTELDAWIRDPKRAPRLTVYDDADGLPSHTRVNAYGPKVTKAADGRLWFATYDGAGVIDPQHIPFNRLPPPVHIELITADRSTYTATSSLRLPSGVRDLRIDYTALSLVAPQKVRFRYRLEGRDEDWVDAGNRRQAFYTDLPPRSYRFRVIASNNDGVWNEVGDTVEFSVPPTVYQTTAFRIALAILIVSMLGATYALRLRRLATQMNVRFEERLAERTRIAQELHDTLLQGSLSASMQLHLLADEVSDDRVKAKLDRLLQRFAQMIDEGRQTVQALRSRFDPADDLEQALAREAKEFKGDQAVDLRVIVEGEGRPLQPLVRDECYRIGCEALANAFRHARATSIAIQIGYSPDRLRVRIRDNGRGIAATTLKFGEPGHWGLQGMHERAEQVGGTLKVTSRLGVGTDVELLVPAALAFPPPEAGRLSRRRVFPRLRASLTKVFLPWLAR